MSCTAPRVVWRKRDPNPETGKYGFMFRMDEGYVGGDWVVPCGKCVGCRLDWAGDWAARCEKEASLWSRNCFVTLTYNDEHLPVGGSSRSSLSKRDWQLFMKRLRKAYGDGIRFFVSGEYGEKNQRAHYHALLFNHDFDDKRLWRKGKHPLYVSTELDALWGLGFASIGSVSYQSASYVARYVMKKLSGELADYSDREAPFVLMSRRPGLGAAWFEKFKSDVYPRGVLVVGEGKERRPPRYFETKFRAENPVRFAELKAERRARAPRVAPGDVGRRRYARDVILKNRISLMDRPI